MFKRVIWFGSGLASGVVGSWWAKRKVKREVQKQAEKYTTVAGLAGEAKRRFEELTGSPEDPAAAQSTTNVVPIRPAEGRAQSAASTVARWRGQARDLWFSRTDSSVTGTDHRTN